MSYSIGSSLCFQAIAKQFFSIFYGYDPIARQVAFARIWKQRSETPITLGSHFLMNSFVHKLTQFDRLLAKGEGWVLIALVVVMTVVVFLQVLYRYLLTQPLYWSEELARYLFVWISILGAALSLQRRGHFGMDFFYRMLPGQGRRFLIFVIYLLMGVVILVLLVEGIFLVRKTAAQQSPAMEISMGWAYACLPVGASLMAIHLLVIIIKEAIKKPKTH